MKARGGGDNGRERGTLPFPPPSQYHSCAQEPLCVRFGFLLTECSRKLHVCWWSTRSRAHATAVMPRCSFRKMHCVYLHTMFFMNSVFLPWTSFVMLSMSCVLVFRVKAICGSVVFFLSPDFRHVFVVSNGYLVFGLHNI